MTEKEVKEAIDKYSEIVMKRPISKDMQGHLIQGFSVKETAPGNFKLYVVGQNQSHYLTFLHKSLKKWLDENNLSED